MCQTPISDNEEITGMVHDLPFQTTRKLDKMYEPVFRVWDSRHSRIVDYGEKGNKRSEI